MLSQTAVLPTPTLQSVVRLSMASAPAPVSIAQPQLYGIYTVAIAGVLLSTAMIYVYTRRHRARARLRRQQQLKLMSDLGDLEAQGQVGYPTVKNGLRLLTLPMLATSGRTLSAAEVMSGSMGLRVSGELPVPAVHVKIGPSSRLRDSILCKAIGQLALPDAGILESATLPAFQKGAEKSIKRVDDIEATAGLEESPKDIVSRRPRWLQWLRQYPSSTQEEAKNERAVDTPMSAAESIPLVVPEIVVVPPSEADDKPLVSEDSLASMYSQASFDGDHEDTPSTVDLEMNRAMIMDTPELDADVETASATSVDTGSILSSLDTPPLETPPLTAQLPLSRPATLTPSTTVAHLATDVSYYFPTLPSFAAADYLQVPLSSWNGPQVQSAADDDDYDDILEFMVSFGLDDSSSVGSAPRPAPSPPTKRGEKAPASTQDMPTSTSGSASPCADASSCSSLPSESAKSTQASSVGLGLSVASQSQQGGDGKHRGETPAPPQRHLRQSKPKSKPKPKHKPNPHVPFSIWEDCDRDRKMQAILTKFWVCDNDQQREELGKAMKELVDSEIQRTTQASNVKQQPTQARRDVHVGIRDEESRDGLAYDYDHASDVRLKTLRVSPARHDDRLDIDSAMLQVFSSLSRSATLAQENPTTPQDSSSLLCLNQKTHNAARFPTFRM
ncbi:hypothetical protein C8Q80DRAFT_807091 [Daedaleopsis nitida]|nr:hypothetical protein C8Q80DRAFT_807091 [Daedaleopsis nitida]